MEGEEAVISVYVESSESLQPSTSQELVERVSELQETSVEMTTSSAEAERGGGEEEERQSLEKERLLLKLTKTL